MKLKDDEIENWARDYAMQYYPDLAASRHFEARTNYIAGMTKARELYEGELNRLQSRLDLHEIKY